MNNNNNNYISNTINTEKQIDKEKHDNIESVNYILII